MVEIVGSAASLITVLDLTAVVGKTLVTFVRDVRDAPKEIQQVAQRILRFQSVVAFQSRLQLWSVDENRGAGSHFLSAEDVNAFREALLGAQGCLESMQKYMTPYKDPRTKVLGVLWTLRDRKPILRLEEDLRAVEDILLNMLMTLNTSVISACPSLWIIDC